MITKFQSSEGLQEGNPFPCMAKLVLTLSWQALAQSHRSSQSMTNLSGRCPCHTDYYISASIDQHFQGMLTNWNTAIEHNDRDIEGSGYRAC